MQGTWPALFNLLERRGRVSSCCSKFSLKTCSVHVLGALNNRLCSLLQKPQHTFLDYCIPNYIIAIIFALTLGQIGESSEQKPNFIPQLHQVRGTMRASTGAAFHTTADMMCTHQSDKDAQILQSRHPSLQFSCSQGQWSVGWIRSGWWYSPLLGQPRHPICTGIHQPVHY